MNRCWGHFLCATLLCTALYPLSASAQLQSPSTWAVDSYPPYAREQTARVLARIETGHPLTNSLDEGGQEPREPFPWRITPPDSPDWKGAARDTAYFMVYQIIVIGALYVAPESTSGWSDEDKDNYDSGKWEENVQNPHRDSDDFFINYILHPYWGATYYIRGRERGLTRTQSFLFSTTLSTLYEFGLEAMFEQPSYQDLWVTPVLGSLVGEFWFTPVRNRIKAQPGELDWTDKTILFLTDPLGVLGAGTDRLLGLDTGIKVTVFHSINTPPLPVGAGGGIRASSGRLLTRTKPAWGLQLHIHW